jgi:colanic acid biosynthesis protein WcaH
MLKKVYFKEVVKNAPLIAIDLIVYDKKGCILLGLRNNNPGMGKWSVPGGRIYKNELLKNTFKKITKNELGFCVDIKNIQFGGIYEHLYKESPFKKADINTHYVTIAWLNFLRILTL